MISCFRISISLAVVAIATFLAQHLFAQQNNNPPATEPDHPAPIVLWPGGAPGSESVLEQKEIVTARVFGEIHFIGVSNVHQPSITPYLPAAEKATGAAVVVAPGGGHSVLAISHEGYFVGQWLADHGIAAFVLKYRLESGSTPDSGAKYKRDKESLADAQRRDPHHPQPGH